MAEKTTEETTGGKYLTKDYLARNLKTFWDKIKDYITTQISGFAKTEDVEKALDDKADQDDLSSLATTVGGKADNSALTALATLLDEKVGKVTGKDLSTNDFTDADKTKLNSLTNDVATESANGLMSADDSVKLNNIAAGATAVTVDSVWDPTSENPAQSKVINTELNKKVDKEDLNPSDLVGDVLNYIESDKGDIIFKIDDSVNHIKIHTDKGELIEKFYLSVSTGSDNSLVFNTFESGTERTITIPNPEREGSGMVPNKFFKFYVECLEILGTGKCKPFILRVVRDTDPKKLRLTAFETF